MDSATPTHLDSRPSDSAPRLLSALYSPCAWAVWRWVAGVCKRWRRYVTCTNLQSHGDPTGSSAWVSRGGGKTISAANTPARMRNVLIFAAALWPLRFWQWWRKCQLFPPLNATLCLSLFLFIDLCLCLGINKVQRTVSCLRMHFPLEALSDAGFCTLLSLLN